MAHPVLSVRSCTGNFYGTQCEVDGEVLGVAVGIGLGMLMDRFRVAERGLLPYVVLSQTVPLIAIAPARRANRPCVSSV